MRSPTRSTYDEGVCVRCRAVLTESDNGTGVLMEWKTGLALPLSVDWGCGRREKLCAPCGQEFRDSFLRLGDRR